MAIQGGPAYTLSKQPWAQPGRFGGLGEKGHCHLAADRLNLYQAPSGLCLYSLPYFIFPSPFSKDQRSSECNLPGDEEQAAEHAAEHVLVLGQQRHGVHPFQACAGVCLKTAGASSFFFF